MGLHKDICTECHRPVTRKQPSVSFQIQPLWLRYCRIRKTNTTMTLGNSLGYTGYFAQNFALPPCKVMSGKYLRGSREQLGVRLKFGAQGHSASLSIKNTGLMEVLLHLGRSCPSRDFQQSQKERPREKREGHFIHASTFNFSSLAGLDTEWGPHIKQ